MFYLLLLVAVCGYSFYHVFIEDTLNRIQYIERLRLYWITRDTGSTEPFISKAFMRQTAAPFWRGHGVQIRLGKYVFQIGRLEYRVDSLASQISNNPNILAGVQPKELRKW